MYTVLLYYGVAILLLLCNFCVYIRVIEDIASTYADYIICTAGGDKVECDVIADRLDDATTSLLIIEWIAGTLPLLLIFVNLNFVIQYSDIKKMIGSLRHSS